MFDFSTEIDIIVKKLTTLLPESIDPVKKEIKKNIKKILQERFEKLDLVTREDFDIQVKVLSKTREKLNKIENQLNNIK